MKKNRLIELDIFKGYAIVFMVLYHLFYDLNYFKYIHIDLDHDIFWVSARNTIVTMFLLAVGISLAMAHKSKIQWNKVKKRVLVLGGISALITLLTYVVFPHTWVYFGILHFILFASLLGLIFLSYPFLSLVLGVGIVASYIFGWLDMYWLFSLLQVPLHLPTYTEDLVPLFPWFGVVLIGMSMAAYGTHEKMLKSRFFRTDLEHNKILAVFGRNALLIYLINQPILFGFLYLWSIYFNV